MNAKIIRKLDMLKTVKTFIMNHPVTPANVRITAATTELTATITALEAAAEGQVTGSSTSEGGVDLRASTARELRVYLKDVCRTGRMLDEEVPGIRPLFRLPVSASYPALLAGAQSIVAAATLHETLMVASGLPATFLTELGALLTAFEDALGQKSSGGITQVMSTAALFEKAKAGMEVARKLDPLVRNAFRNQPELIAAWAYARRVEADPQRKGETTPPAPAPTPSA